MTEEKPVKLSIYLTEDKRARFKSACALDKKSMNEVLSDFIDKYVEQKTTPSPVSNSKGE